MIENMPPQSRIVPLTPDHARRLADGIEQHEASFITPKGDGWLTPTERIYIASLLRNAAASEKPTQETAFVLREIAECEALAEGQKEFLRRLAKTSATPSAEPASNSRELVRSARAKLMRAWEKSGEGAIGPLSKLITDADAWLQGTPASATSAHKALLLCRQWIEADEGRSLDSILEIEGRAIAQLGKGAFNAAFVEMCKALNQAIAEGRDA